MNSIRGKSCFAPLAGLAGILWLAAGCDNFFDQDNTPTPVAFVSLYHASPDAPDLGIIVDNRQINNGPFEYSEYTGYLRFFTGSRNLRFSPYGANNVVADTTINLEDGKAYSIFFVDDFQDADILILGDSGEVADGKAMVRFLNLSPDAAAVSLVADGQTDPLFADLAFKSVVDFKQVDATDYDFLVTSASGDTLLELPGTQLNAGQFYTIVVRGYQSPPSGNSNVLSSEILGELNSY